MSKSYVIQWKSKVNGRAGKGTKLFDKAEAERLAAELNREYPDIQHQATPAESPVASFEPVSEAHTSRGRTHDEADETDAEPLPFFSTR